MAQFTFDGPNKLIIGAYTPVSSEFTADAAIDLYSDWKEWAVLDDNSKYAQALSTVGGEQIGVGVYTGSYFFLENGWKIRPIEQDHRLIVSGNLYTSDGTSPFVATLGSYNVLMELRNSSLTQGLSTSGGSGATPAEVWAYSIDGKTAAARLSTAEKKAKIASRK